jgi:hypothetical protein
MTLEEKCYFLSLLWRRVGGWGDEKRLCEMVDYPSTQKKGFKGAWLEFEINVSCFLLLLFRYFSTFSKQQSSKNTTTTTLI